MAERRTIYVGLDVSKDRLDVHLRPLGEAFHVPRDAKGLEVLARRFGSLPVALVVLEATGGFPHAMAANQGLTFNTAAPSCRRCRGEFGP